MHYTWEHCKQDAATGTAQCQADIDGAAAYALIREAIERTVKRVAVA